MAEKIIKPNRKARYIHAFVNRYLKIDSCLVTSSGVKIEYQTGVMIGHKKFTQRGPKIQWVGVNFGTPVEAKDPTTYQWHFDPDTTRFMSEYGFPYVTRLCLSAMESAPIAYLNDICARYELDGIKSGLMPDIKGLDLTASYKQLEVFKQSVCPSYPSIETSFMHYYYNEAKHTWSTGAIEAYTRNDTTASLGIIRIPEITL